MNSGTIAKLIILAVALLLMPMAQVYAATLTTSASCTINNAIDSANDNQNTGGCVATGTYGNDTINLHADVTMTGKENIGGSETITINGNGFTITAGSNARHFTVWENGSLNLNDVTLTGGNAIAGAISTTDGGGGSQTVNINRSRICNNRSTGDTAAILTATTTTLTIYDSVICNNTASGSLGAIDSSGTLTIVRSVFYGNRAATNGAALAANGDTTITNSVFYDNRATRANTGEGGALWFNSLSGKTISLRHVTLTGNHAAVGQAIYITGAAGSVEIRNTLAYGNTGNTQACLSISSGAVTVSTGNLFESSSNCGTPLSTADPGLIARTSATPLPYYTFGTGSVAYNAVRCISGVNQDLLGNPRPRGSQCDIGAIEIAPPPPPDTTPPSGNGGGSGNGGNGGGGGGSGDSSRASAKPEPEPVRISPAQTCADLMLAGIMVSNQSAGTACNRVDGSSIGHPEVAASGFMDAVDVWGWVTPDTKVCFNASSGSIRFIDTTAMPRTVSDLPAFSEAGMICGMIDRAGQVALVPGPPAPPAASDPAPESAEPSYGASLSDCMVRAKYSLNFRDAPAGSKIGGVPHNATLTALERTVGWFKVDYHGAQGWIAAMYVEPIGACG